MEGGKEVSNKQVILRELISGFPKELDFELRTGHISPEVPKGSSTIVVKNLYFSCDPRMRILMQKPQEASLFTAHYATYTPGSVLDSGHPNFKKYDLVWGTIGWEEYNLITTPDNLIKIEHTDVPLSYYTGILGSDNENEENRA